MCSLALILIMLPQEPGGSWTESGRIEGSHDYGKLGWCAALIGDINHDGCAEYVLGAPEQENFGLIVAGSVYVIDGRTCQVIWEIKNDQYGGSLGADVCAVGDVNHDGIPDFAATEVNAGDQSFIYDGASGAILVTIPEPPVNRSYGISMTGVGDWNQDGTPDVAVSDYFADVGPDGLVGSIYVYSGLDGSLIQRIDGIGDSHLLGSNLEGGGDLNGDGIQDLLARSNYGWGNSVHVFSGGTGLEIMRIGSPNGAGFLGVGMDIVPDQDGDGCDEMLIGNPPSGFVPGTFGEAYLFSGRTGALMYRWVGEQHIESNFGGGVACAGDMNRDGSLDFVIGDSDMGTYPFYTGEGRIYFYSGSDGRLLHTITGTQRVGIFGDVLAGGMDISGDGRPDIVVTSFGYDVGGILNAGAAFVYSYDPFIAAPLREFSAGAGGTLSFALDFPDTEAGLEYRILASTNRTDQDWLTVRGLAIPLVETSLVYRTWNHPLAGMQGGLDVHGNALVSLQVPAGSASAEVGRTFRFAAVSLAAATQPSLASGAVLVTVLP